MVLGEKLYEGKGKVIRVSIKSVGPEGVHIEETFTGASKGFGRYPGTTDMATIDVVEAPGGSSSGSGQGISTTQDGDTVTWKAYGFGKSEAGKNKSVVIIQFMTTSQKLSWMNSLIVVEEDISDPKTMELSWTGYEWK